MALAIDNVVVALGARDGRGEPDLFVGRLFIYDVGTDFGESYVQNARLRVGMVLVIGTIVVEERNRFGRQAVLLHTYRVLHVNTLVLLRKVLQARQDDLEIRVGYLMVLAVRELGRDCLGFVVLHVGGSRVV